MGDLPHANSFRDLIVYQKSRQAAKDLFELSKTFPKEEMYSLTDQTRRSSRSVGGQIAEAWGKRRYPNHFISKLTDADSEQLETQHWVDTAGDCDYLSSRQAVALNAQLLELGRMPNAMINKADEFCGPNPSMVRENQDEYFGKIHKNSPTTKY